MDNLDRSQLIEEAQELVREAKEKVDEALKGTLVEANYQAYGKYGFNQLLGRGNPYDRCLDDLLEDLEEE